MAIPKKVAPNGCSGHMHWKCPLVPALSGTAMQTFSILIMFSVFGACTAGHGTPKAMLIVVLAMVTIVFICMCVMGDM